jgi:hypothetical protein
MLGARRQAERQAMRFGGARARAIGALLALAVLGACANVGGLRAQKPDATVSFDEGWDKASVCAQAQLANIFSAAKLVKHSGGGFAEITVGGNFSLETVMVVFIQDTAPGKAEAQIHSHDYMLIWGSATDRAVAAMSACRKAAT